MGLCPFFSHNPECLRKGCEIYVHETSMCAFVDIAIDLQFVACMRDLIQEFVTEVKKDANQSVEPLGEEIEDKEND